MKIPKVLLLLLLTSIASGVVALRADGPADNSIEKVRRVPPPGVKIPEADRAEIEAATSELGTAISGLRSTLPPRSPMMNAIPDVEVFHKALSWALKYDEFFKTNEIRSARNVIKEGMARVVALRSGEIPWNSATGLVVRAYVSKIDGSIQPYGLVVPPSFRPNSPTPFRLDAWFHGRGETMTELDFIQGRMTSAGEFTPPNSIVLHLYGRYCNANKFAGDVDLLEALDDVKRHYPIDDNRIVVRGFSMGGAACWQFAVHYADRWAAAAPGAGFSETADFLKVFQRETVQPTWYEKKLWHWYDATDYAINLFQLPTVAYSGEIDGQKQAADMMAKALAEEGITLTHIIGPKTPHRYHPDSKIEINRRIDSIVAKGRDPLPAHIRFTTFTLRYPSMFWVKIGGMGRHWERARVNADLDSMGNSVTVQTTNVTALTLDMPAGLAPFNSLKPVKVIVDGQTLQAPPALSDRSWSASFAKQGGQWVPATSPTDGKLRKTPGLQGPIDDAFMDSFLMVKPTGQPLNEKVGAWAAAEMNHALDQWRSQFRGEARIKDDSAVTAGDIETNNLILWGDPSSNQLLAKIADKLPIQWSSSGIKSPKQYDASHHVVTLVYPNPLNSKRYVVLNSGFTFREYDYLNNARQIAKLPDYAVLDINSPVTPRLPGMAADAGFFDEEWRLPSTAP